MRKKADEACDKRIAEERLKIILAAPDPGVGRSLVNQRKAMRRIVHSYYDAPANVNFTLRLLPNPNTSDLGGGDRRHHLHCA